MNRNNKIRDHRPAHWLFLTRRTADIKLIIPERDWRFDLTLDQRRET